MGGDLLTTAIGTSVSIVPPDGWETAEGLVGTLVAFVAPDEDPGFFRPNFNVLVETESEVVAPGDLVERHAAGAIERLEFARLIDAGACEVGERPASRVLLTYSSDGDDLTLEQWIVPFGRKTLVLSATSATLDYASTFEVFQDIIGSVDFDA